MKKTLLALAIAATAASSVNAAQIVKTDTGSIDFYGQLRQYIYSGDDYKNFDLKSSSSRAGVDLAYHLTPMTDFVGNFEFNINDTDAFTNRYHYVGISNADYGTLLVGKQETIFDDIWGVENSYNNGGSSVLPESNGGIDWIEQAMVKYKYESDAGWAQASYAHDNSDSNIQMTEIYGGTSFDDISVYGGMGYADNGTGIYTGDSNDETTMAGKYLYHFMGTVAYDNGTYGVGVTYWYMDVKDKLGQDVDVDSQSIAIAGNYNLNEKSSVYGTYEMIQDYAGDGLDFNELNVGADYRFSAAFRVFGEVAFIDDDDAGSSNLYTLGARFYW